jgi:hypothetical protein
VDVTDIRLEELKRWLASIPTEPDDVASRVYINAKRGHVGERPKWCRVEWHNMDQRYREFLVGFVRAGMEHQKLFGTPSLQQTQD